MAKTRNLSLMSIMPCMLMMYDGKKIVSNRYLSIAPHFVALTIARRFFGPVVVCELATVRYFWLPTKFWTLCNRPGVLRIVLPAPLDMHLADALVCLGYLFVCLFVCQQDYWTSSHAVAERPRDVSCLSVVSFNSTIRRAQSSIIGYFGFRFTAAHNWILFRSLRFGVFTDAWRPVS